MERMQQQATARVRNWRNITGSTGGKEVLALVLVLVALLSYFVVPDGAIAEWFAALPTAAQVWDNLRDYYALFEYELLRRAYPEM
jgi:hypothetical protein